MSRWYVMCVTGSPDEKILSEFGCPRWLNRMSFQKEDSGTKAYWRYVGSEKLGMPKLVYPGQWLSMRWWWTESNILRPFHLIFDVPHQRLWMPYAVQSYINDCECHVLFSHTSTIVNAICCSVIHQRLWMPYAVQSYINDCECHSCSVIHQRLWMPYHTSTIVNAICCSVMALSCMTLFHFPKNTFETLYLLSKEVVCAQIPGSVQITLEFINLKIVQLENCVRIVNHSYCVLHSLAYYFC
jgi:hypothetical protein